MVVHMNATHRKTFIEYLPLKAYIDELWDSRTSAPVGTGVSASRAHLLKFSRRYWPARSKLKVYLGDWDSWSAQRPQPEWFTQEFQQVFYDYWHHHRRSRRSRHCRRRRRRHH